MDKIQEATLRELLAKARELEFTRAEVLDIIQADDIPNPSAEQLAIVMSVISEYFPESKTVQA